MFGFNFKCIKKPMNQKRNETKDEKEKMGYTKHIPK